jgi:predicted transcriptional regulator
MSVTLSPAAESLLSGFSARTGRPVAEVVEAAVTAYLRSAEPVAHVPGVDPAEVWAAAAEEEAGRLTPHEEVFARLRGRK